MWMPENWNETPSELKLKRLGRWWLPLACGVGGGIMWQKEQQGYMLALAMMGGASLVLGWVRPAGLLVLYFTGRLLGLLLAWVMTFIMLGVAYVLLVTPLAWWLRWRKHDPLQLKFEPDKTSYWCNCPTDNFPEDALRPY